LLNYPIDFLSHNFIRLGLTRAKVLQTVSQFPRETRRRYAAPKSNAFTLPDEKVDNICCCSNLKFRIISFLMKKEWQILRPDSRAVEKLAGILKCPPAIAAILVKWLLKRLNPNIFLAIVSFWHYYC